MQDSDAINQAMWKQRYQDALLELDPRRLRPKLEAAQRAVEGRLSELHSDDDSHHREFMELTDAQHALRCLQNMSSRP
jgi:hypothetical protein